LKREIHVSRETFKIRIVSKAGCERVLKAMKKHKYGKDFKIIGEVPEANPG